MKSLLNPSLGCHILHAPERQEIYGFIGEHLYVQYMVVTFQSRLFRLKDILDW